MWVDIHRENERGDIMRLVKPLKVRFQQHSFVIHSGFECDGVSVPRFAFRVSRGRWFLPASTRAVSGLVLRMITSTGFNLRGGQGHRLI